MVNSLSPRRLLPVMLTSLVSLLFTLSASGAAKDSRSTIVVRVADYPPQYYQDETGQWTGLDVELARALVLEAGFTPEFIAAPWGRALEEMKLGHLQLMTTLSKTPERSTFMHWIGPERISRMVLVVKKSDEQIPISSFAELVAIAKERKTKVGMQYNVFYGHDFAEQLMNPEVAGYFEPVAQSILNPRKTRAGRILGFFEEKLSMQYQIKHDAEYQGLATHSFTLLEEEVFFGVSRTVPNETLNRLRDAFQRLASSGRLDSIRTKEWW